VLGDNVGPSKAAAIKTHHLKTLSEGGFLELIATRKGPGDGKGLSEKEMEKEEKMIRDSATELEAREKTVVPNTQLWTDRYAPQTLKVICGNKGQVEKLQQWLNEWYVPLSYNTQRLQLKTFRSNSLKANFKKPGKEQHE